MLDHSQEGNQFTVVDLDPYGSASSFLNTATQCVKDGGMLCVTCTDLSVLCGNSHEVGYRNYGGFSVNDTICHEMALRLLLNAIAKTAAQNRKYIEPLLSLYVDYYIRIFVRVYDSALSSKYYACNISDIFYCHKCHIFQAHQIGAISHNKNGNKRFQVNKKFSF